MQTLSKIQLILFALLSIIDLTTTYLILKAGGAELNPFFASNPVLLVPAKIAAVAAIIGITLLAEKKIGIWGNAAPASANILTGYVCIRNLVILGVI
jgi:hypothetical protein